MSNPQQRRNLFPAYIGLGLLVTVSAFFVFMITVVAPILDEERSKDNDPMVAMSKDPRLKLYDTEDFPEVDMQVFVEDCFAASNTYLVREVDGNGGVACGIEGTTFFVGSKMPSLECYQPGDQNWSLSSCSREMFAGSLDRALEFCAKEHMVYIVNEDPAHCLSGNEPLEGVIFPGDLVECYDTTQDPAVTEECPDFAYSMDHLYYDDTMPPSTVPSDVPLCSKDIVVYDALSGESFCLSTGEPLPRELYKFDGEATCFDIKLREVVDCSRALSPELYPEPNSEPA